MFASTKEEKDLYWITYATKHDHKIYEIDSIRYIRFKLEEKLGKKFWNLKPTFQAPIITDTRRYYIDLYFEAINIGVEIDEKHHKEQKDEDTVREFNIIETLNASNKQGYKACHICVYDTYERKMQDLNNAIDTIVNACKNKDFIWNDKPGLAVYKSGSYITSGAVFVNKSDVSNTLLQESLNGKAKPGQKSNLEIIYVQNKLPVPKKCALQQTWPERKLNKLYKNDVFSVRNQDKWNHKILAHEEWMNDYSTDLSTIKMYNDIPNYIAIRNNGDDKSHNAKDDNKIHHFFTHDDNDTVTYLGGYKLINVEKTDRCESYKKNKKTVNVQFKYVLNWKRVCTKLKIA